MLDFVSGRPADGKQLRTLTVVDHFDRPYPALYAAHLIRAGTGQSPVPKKRNNPGKALSR